MPTTDELTSRRRTLVLLTCCLSLLIVGMDATIVNVALPSIRTDLHASLSDLQWTIDAYTLVLAAFLILSGSTADRIGRRRTFQTGLAVFTTASLLCSVAPSLGWLVAFRMLQAIGGSMLNPVAMSIITNVFIDPRERARAIGVWGGVVGLSLGLGPVIGGLLIGWLDWRAIFWINVPIGIAAIVLAAVFVPESKAPRARRVDPVGQVLVIAILGGLTYAIIDGPESGWASARTIGLIGAVAIALVVLLAYERRRPEPLIEVRFFRSIPFAGATAMAVCGFAAFSGYLFLNTLYLQEVRHLSALHAGLLVSPMAVITLVVAPLSGRVVGARGARGPLVLAGVAMTAGAIMMTGLTAHTSYGWLVASYVVFSVGFAALNAPITNTAVSGMPRSQAGVAAAFASTSRQIGASLGVAVVGSLIAAGVSVSLVQGLASASHAAWWMIAGCGVAVAGLGLVTTGRHARQTARETASEFEDALV